MKFISPVLLPAIAILISHLAATTSAAAENPFTISGRPAADRSMLADLSALHILDLCQPNSTWIVAQATVDPGSGSLGGTMIPPSTPGGRPTLETSMFVGGAAKVLSNVHGTFAAGELKFRWDNPHGYAGIYGNGTVPRPVWSRLHDGVFLLRINTGGVQKNDPILSAIELPDGTWAPFFVEAAAFTAAHDKTFDPLKIADNREDLTALAQGKNPILAMADFKLLVSKGLPEPKVIRGAVSARPYMILAAMTDALISAVPADAKSAYAALEPLISPATDAQTAEGFVVGAAFGHQPTGGGRKLADKIINGVSDRRSSLKGPQESLDAVKRIIDIYRLENSGR